VKFHNHDIDHINYKALVEFVKIKFCFQSFPTIDIAAILLLFLVLKKVRCERNLANVYANDGNDNNLAPFAKKFELFTQKQ